ncbi:MAG: hypothetical protein WBA57_11570 [Elainellaceae cyanobacterium]
MICPPLFPFSRESALGSGGTGGKGITVAIACVENGTATVSASRALVSRLTSTRTLTAGCATRCFLALCQPVPST